MAEQRILAALARIDNALERIDATPVPSASETISIEQYRKLRHAASGALSDIDKLLSTLANDHG